MAIQPGVLGHLSGCIALKKLDLNIIAAPEGHRAPAASAVPPALLAAGAGAEPSLLLPGGIVLMAAASGMGRLAGLRHLEVLSLRGDVSMRPCSFEALAGLRQLTTLTLWTKVWLRVLV